MKFIDRAAQQNGAYVEFRLLTDARKPSAEVLDRTGKSLRQIVNKLELEPTVLVRDRLVLDLTKVSERNLSRVTRQVMKLFPYRYEDLYDSAF